MLPRKLQSSLFTWLEWRNGSPADFLVPCREEALVGARYRLRSKAVGYCDAENLSCRPKRDCKAVMFEIEPEKLFWFHLTNREFNKIFNDR